MRTEPRYKVGDILKVTNPAFTLQHDIDRVLGRIVRVIKINTELFDYAVEYLDGYIPADNVDYRYNDSEVTKITNKEELMLELL